MELSRWVDIPAERPPELHMNVIRSLQEYSMAAAQSITMKKGLITGISQNLMAKLAMQNYMYMDRFVAACRSTKNYKELIPTKMRKYLPYLQSISKATAYKYMALNAYNEQKYGAASSYMIVAVESLKKIKKKPISSVISKEYGTEIQEAILEIEHVYRKCWGENEHIYYQKVLSEDELEKIEPKSAVQVNMWLPPPPAYDRLI